MPLVAFDARGYRLGYGGGFYDRTLARAAGRRPTLAVGFAFAAQELPEVPIEETDQQLDVIITETGLTDPASAPSLPGRLRLRFVGRVLARDRLSIAHQFFAIFSSRTNMLPQARSIRSGVI